MYGKKSYEISNVQCYDIKLTAKIIVCYIQELFIYLQAICKFKLKVNI